MVSDICILPCSGSHTSDNLFSDEVTDLNLVAVGLLVPLNVDVDGETGIQSQLRP